MKELSVLSLICSCFYSQPHPNTIYQYGGECAHSLSCGLLTPGLAGFWRGAFGESGWLGTQVCRPSMSSHILWLRPRIGCVLGIGPSTQPHLADLPEG